MDILLKPLREGRFNFIISDVGGVKITRAEILGNSNDDKNEDHLFDWKFFNALIDPSSDLAGSGDRLYDVFVGHKPTMKVIIDSVSLLSKDLGSFLNHIMKAVYRAKDILKAENINQPKNAIPHKNMARLFSLLLSSDTHLIDRLSPMIHKVVKGEGLDCESLKEILRENLDGDWGGYAKFSNEIDRLIKLGEFVSLRVCEFASLRVCEFASLPSLPNLPNLPSLQIFEPHHTLSVANSFIHSFVTFSNTTS